jgi:hypothetical protein
MSSPASATKRARLEQEPESDAAEREVDLLTDEEAKVVRIQFEKEVDLHPFSFNFDDLKKEYCRFMHLKLKYPSISFAPSSLLDKFWHAHILCTRQYLAFCVRSNNSEFIHHDPMMTSGPERYKLTKEYYEKEFGEVPNNVVIWPDDVDDKCWMEKGFSDDEGDRDFVSDNRPYSKAEKDYIKEYGDQRGRTRRALRKWHRKAMLNRSINDQYDPREHPDILNCGSGHRWYDYGFDLSCPDCRTS